MKVYIITGASKGLGSELAKQLAGEGTHIIGISRSKNIKVERTVVQNGAEVSWREVDLSRTDVLIKEGPDLFPLPFKLGKIEEIGLINNAATVEPIGFAGDFDVKKAAAAVSLNFTAAAVLISFFISTYRGVPLPKKVLNITSGAADYAIPGAGVYSSTKAALDMFTRTVAKEQRREEYPVAVAGISPGMIDTGMQERLRKAAPDRLPGRDYYIQAFDEGKVVSPETVAKKIIDFFLSDFETGTITHV